MTDTPTPTPEPTPEPTPTPDPTPTPPSLPVSAAETPEQTREWLSTQVAAEVDAIANLVTLRQPVPVHVLGELHWYCAAEMIGTGQEHPGDCNGGDGGGGGAPTFTSINPTSGPVAGGTVVTITGTGFTGATNVVFGAEAAASFTVDSDTQVTATTPASQFAQAGNTSDVTVMTPNGNAVSGPDDWTWT